MASAVCLKMEGEEKPARLYIVALAGGAADGEILQGADAVRLRPGLYLVRTTATQSQLYHAVKREAKPDALFVGPLAGNPKFKGMGKGTLSWLRGK